MNNIMLCFKLNWNDVLFLDVLICHSRHFRLILEKPGVTEETIGQFFTCLNRNKSQYPVVLSVVFSSGVYNN